MPIKMIRLYPMQGHPKPSYRCVCTHISMVVCVGAERFFFFCFSAMTWEHALWYPSNCADSIFHRKCNCNASHNVSNCVLFHAEYWPLLLCVLLLLLLRRLRHDFFSRYFFLFICFSGDVVSVQYRHVRRSYMYSAIPSRLIKKLFSVEQTRHIRC